MNSEGGCDIFAELALLVVMVLEVETYWETIGKKLED